MKILLIDDNQQITKMVSQLLEIEGHQVVVCNDGCEGQEMILKNGYDVVVLDLSMPGCSGFDIIDKLEEEDKLKDNKIIVFTAASVSESDLNALVDRGVHGYLTKPIDMDLFLEKIKS